MFLHHQHHLTPYLPLPSSSLDVCLLRLLFYLSITSAYTQPDGEEKREEKREVEASSGHD